MGLAAPASARPVEAATICHAGGAIGETYRNLLAVTPRWDCHADSISFEPDVTFIRFVLKQRGTGQQPRSFVSQYGRFDRITLTALDEDGTARSLDYPIAAIQRVNAGPFFSAALPEVTEHTSVIFARIERPWVKHVLSQARLDDQPEGSGWPIMQIAIIAMICGVLMVAWLLNAAFYLAVPKAYVVWHLVILSATLIQASILIGLFTAAIAVPLRIEIAITDLSFGALGIGTLMFVRGFIEPGKLGPYLPRAMITQAILCIPVVAAVTLLLPGMRTWAILIVHLVLLPNILLLIAAMIVARRRGSRAVLFLIIGWTPVALVLIWRIASFVFNDQPSEAVVSYHAALAFEVLVTAVAVISRFALAHRERDHAHIQVEQLQVQAGQDALTGLLNRHALDLHFTQWYRHGFRTIAVIDLDHFKAVNDTLGHAMGDAVLRAVAVALAPDGNTHVVRIGGEEFLLMLRGKNAVERAERRRQAIPVRVAAMIPGLDRVITASMGLVEHDGVGREPTTFLSCYKHCDRLLYEAKRTGRNRALREKLTGFTPAQRELVRAKA